MKRRGEKAYYPIPVATVQRSLRESSTQKICPIFGERTHSALERLEGGGRFSTAEVWRWDSITSGVVSAVFPASWSPMRRGSPPGPACTAWLLIGFLAKDFQDHHQHVDFFWIDLWKDFGRFLEPKWSQTGTKHQSKIDSSFESQFFNFIALAAAGARFLWLKGSKLKETSTKNLSKNRSKNGVHLGMEF